MPWCALLHRSTDLQSSRTNQTTKACSALLKLARGCLLGKPCYPNISFCWQTLFAIPPLRVVPLNHSSVEDPISSGAQTNSTESLTCLPASAQVEPHPASAPSNRNSCSFFCAPKLRNLPQSRITLLVSLMI